jgi:hypothetical protein
MEHRLPTRFAEAQLDFSLKLAVATDLQRELSPVLTDPIPRSRQRLIEQLEALAKDRLNINN